MILNYLSFYILVITSEYVFGSELNSLTFVIDDTSSMWDDIDQVKQNVNKIFNAVLNHRNESQIDNFVLVTFNDHSYTNQCHDKGTLRVKTKDRPAFLSALSAIITNDGAADCEECSMAGIKLALDESLPRSSLYIFTDATAKDHERFEEVKRLALVKQCQIVFVLTGQCGKSTTSPDYKVYEDMASVTQGQVFHTDKHEVGIVINFVVKTITGRMDTVNSTILPPGAHNITFNVDALMGEVLFSLTSMTYNSPSVTVKGPDGSDVWKQIVFDTNKAKVYAFNATKPGSHTIQVVSTAEARAVVSAKSGVDFQHGFSSIKLDSLVETSTMPAPGYKTHLLIKLNEGDIKLKSVKFLDINDNLLRELSLEISNNATGFYTTEEFDPPNEMFKIAIIGYHAESESNITRTIPAYIETKKPIPGETIDSKVPSVVIEGEAKVTVNFDEPLKLTCKVQAYPQPNIIWKNVKKGTVFPTETLPGNNFPANYVNVLHIEKATENATYSCEANNTIKSDSRQVTVEVIRKRYLKIISSSDKDMKVEYEKEVKIFCTVDAYPLAVITWYKDDILFVPSGNVEIQISGNNSIVTIKGATLADKGKYTCVVSNEDTKQSVDMQITVVGTEPPTIDKKVTSMTVIKGLSISIECKVLNGKPKPSITWYYGTTSLYTMEKWRDQERIVISNADSSYSGKYQCKAENDVGIDQHELQLLVEIPATIEPPAEINKNVTAGEKQLTLSCEAKGVPEPEIKWLYQNSNASVPAREIIDFKGKTLLKLENILLSHDGNYTCVANNSAGSSNITYSVHVFEQPEIYKKVTRTTVLKGTRTTIDCKILKGKPWPSITWSYGITSPYSIMKKWNNQEQIVIRNVGSIDTGTYQCKAENEVGADQHELQLLVEIPATIEPPKELIRNLIVGQKESTLSCKAIGEPEPEIKWMYQSFDTRIPSREILEFKGETSLQLKNIRLSHEGNYTCIASNAAGASDISYTVHVFEPPELDKNMTRITVLKGMSTTIECKILKGKPRPSITWSYGITPPYSTMEKWSNQEQIVISNVGSIDSGTYQCKAENEVGADQHELQLLVEIPVTIEPPKELIRNLIVGHKESTLSCKAIGEPEPEIKWMYQSFDTRVPSREILEFKGETSFQLENIRFSHEGNYTCIASNSAGSSDITYTVHIFEPPEIDNKVTRITVLNGISTTIECKTLKGKPRPSITWSYGITPPYSTMKKWNNQEQIVISNVSGIDTGIYQCKAENEVGTDQHELELLVEIPATIELPKELIKNLIVRQKQSALSCKAIGQPEPEIKWLYQSFDTRVPSREILEFKGETSLQLQNIRFSHEGNYTCIASNSVGSSDITYTVHVFEPPEIDKKVTRITVLKGMSATIECKILKGKPRPSITWSYGYSPPYSTMEKWNNQEQIVIINVGSIDTGIYQCKAVNKVGTDQHELQLLVETVPASIERPKELIRNLIVGQKQSALSCKAIGQPEPEIKWTYQSFDTRVPSREILEFKGETLLQLKNILLSHEGNYTCIASNSAGSSDITYSVQVFEPPEIDKKVTRIAVLKGLSTTIECKILRGKPRPSITWSYGSTSPYSTMEKWNNQEQIVISNVGSIDTGTYQCKAENKVGTDQHELQLLVEIPATIEPPKELIRNLIVGQKQSSLSCEAIGQPEPEIKWLYQSFDTRVPSREILEFKGKTLLQLKNILLSQEGNYTCIASNSAGSSDITYTIQVFEPPEIDKKVTRITVLKGISTSIECKILRGKPRPSITWSYGSTSPYSTMEKWNNQEQIVISNVGSIDTGTYQCKAENKVGTDQHELQLLVEIPATIEPPKELIRNLIVGQKQSSLSCEAIGQPEPEIKWLYQSFDTRVPSREILEFKGKTLLQLKNILLSQEGNYTCIASNSAGSSDITYTIQVFEPPEIDKKVTRITVLKGISTSIECKILRGKPRPSITWSYGSTSPYSTMEKWNNQEQIVISNVGSIDTGTYQCKAENKVGTDQHELQLLVEIPATIEPPKELIRNLIVGQKQSSLSCEAIGQPEPEIKWLYQSFDTRVPSREILEFKGKTLLQLKNILLSQEGNYTCIASNSAGSSDITYTIQVFEPPEIDKKVTRITVLKGISTSIECKILRGKPRPSITWSYGSTSPYSTMEKWNNQEQIVISNVGSIDTGTYQCKAENKVGTDQHELQLLVEIPATIEPPKELIRNLIVGQKQSSLSCEAIGQPEPEIKWLYQSFDTRVPSREILEFKGKTLLQLKNILLSQEGNYTCIASNSAGSSDITYTIQVFEPPEIDKKVTRITVLKGISTSIECKILRGKPRPSITWSYGSTSPYSTMEKWNNQEQIVISNVGSIDTGTYQCKAENKVGTDQHELQLLVEIPATIEPPKVLIRNLIVGQKQSSLSCEAIGQPEPEIKWLYQSFDTRVPSREILEFKGKTLLQLKNILLSQEGNYTCIASNSAGSSDITYTIQVFEPPEIDKKVTRITVLKGISTSIECKILRGKPRPSITWSYGSTSPYSTMEKWNNQEQIVISNVGSIDTGTYQCKAENKVGTDQHELQLLVEIPATIEPPKELIRNLIVSQKQSVLSCKAIGQPEPEIKWLYQSFETHVPSKEILEFKGKTLLQLKNILLSHEGNYTCIASNSAGSSDIIYTVQVFEPPEIDKKVTRIAVLKGLSTTIECKILRGKPRPSITWSYGSTSPYSTMKKWNNQEQILIRNVGSIDTGTYQCKAENKVGTDQHELQLLVEIPATIESPKELIRNLIVGQKQSVLSCKAIGQPKPEIKWLYQSFDTRVPSRDILEFKGETLLQLKNILLSHEGNYTCIANNSAGSSDITYSVQVFEPPEIDKKVTRIAVLKGLSTTIECKILRGKPRPSITWSYGSTSPYSTMKKWNNQEQIVISNVGCIDTGTYQCKAENKVGTDQHELQLLVEIPATIEPPKRLIRNLMVGQKRSALSCRAKGEPEPEIKWIYQSFNSRVPPREILKAKGYKLLQFENIQLSHEGNYTCIASNSAGSSNITYNLHVFDGPRIDKSVSTELYVERGLSAKLECKILRGIPKPSISWYFKLRGGIKDAPENLKEIPKWKNKEIVVLEKAFNKNSGTYQCRAENKISTDYLYLNLFVQYRPRIFQRGKIKKSNFIKAKVGSEVSIPCYVTAIPSPNITWFKDGMEVANVGKPYTFGPSGLRFVAQLSHKGKYMCNATNKFGSDTKTVKVFVTEPATILIPRVKSYSLPVGSEVKLPCQTSGNPKPVIKWTYRSFAASTSSNKTFKHEKNNSLHLKHIQVLEEGYYACIAINSGGSMNVTYEVQVFAPAAIENRYKDTRFVVVEGDRVLKIYCNATGNPKPTITWTKNGLNLSLGSTYFVEEGMLFIINVPSEAGGFYTCEAQNPRSIDQVTYEVVVEKYPPFNVAASTIFIEEGHSEQLKCLLPHENTDQLRWYQNEVLIHTGELLITKASQRDSGYYSCRVSTFTISHSKGFNVFVGYGPKFTTIENKTVNMIDGLPVSLNCESDSRPEGQVKWYHDDKELDLTEATFYFPEGITDPGQYRCEVMNRFGNISRIFYATREDCMLNPLVMRNTLAPLMFNSNLTWIEFEKSNENILLSKGTQVIFYCPTGFNQFPNKYVNAFCNGGVNFFINGEDHDHSDIKCTEEVKNIAHRKRITCMPGYDGEYTETINIGYKELDGVEIVVYEVCLDESSNTPIYAKQVMQRSLADDEYETSWSDSDQFQIDFEEAYECRNQIEFISYSLKRWFHNRDGCCFSKRQLVNPRDVFPGVPQKSTYSYFNAVPHWSTCNAQNWNDMEERVRNVVKKLDTPLLVWTGTAQKLLLPTFSGSQANIFISDYTKNQQQVPLFLWKVIQDPITKSSLAIIQINVPDLQPDEVRRYILCNDRCDYIDWLKNDYWHDVRKGYIYCCRLDEFENAFGFEGVFEPDMNFFPIYI